MYHLNEESPNYMIIKALPALILEHILNFIKSLFIIFSRSILVLLNTNYMSARCKNFMSNT